MVDFARGSAQRSERKTLSHPQLWLSVDIDGVVVDHVDDGHAQVAPDAEGDAEAQAAHDGDDVAFGQAAAMALARRRPGPARRHRPALSCQLQGLLRLHVRAIDLPEWVKKGKMKACCLSNLLKLGWTVPCSPANSSFEALTSWGCGELMPGRLRKVSRDCTFSRITSEVCTSEPSSQTASCKNVHRLFMSITVRANWRSVVINSVDS